MARRRLFEFRAVAPDPRSPEERRRENEKFLELLPTMVKQELYERVTELVHPEDDWMVMLEAQLDRDSYLDVVEAFVVLDQEGKLA